MINSEQEIQTFLQAKKRLESLGAKYNVPLEVGAFLPFMPGFSRKPAAFKAQIENQKRYELPIWLVETGIQRQNNLAYAEGIDPTYNSQVQSDLDDVVDQVARLRDLDSNALEDLVVAPHVGILAVDMSKGDFSKPGFLSVHDFAERRDRLLKQAEIRFGQLRERGKSLGLNVCLENAYLASFQDSNFWQKHSDRSEGEKKFSMHYEVLNDLHSLTEISQGNLVFDIAHFAVMQNIPDLFEENGDVISPDDLFSTMAISSWNEYRNRVGKIEYYLNQSHAIHISQVEGIGVRLPSGSDEARRWGGSGERRPLISNETFCEVLRFGYSHDLPIGLEPDYKFPISYIEADELLEPIIKYLSRGKS